MNTTAEPDVDTVVEASVCYHCGDPCDDVPIEYAGHKFCCNGCRSVFEILNENDLFDFYRIRPERVNTQKGSSGTVYAYLDDEKVQSELLDFQAEDASVVRFYIPSIHCSACIWLLGNMHKLKEGIQNVQVNFGKKEALIQFNPSLISLKEVAELMDSIGYATAGAMYMMLFGLGTLPMMLAVHFARMKTGQRLRTTFRKLTPALVMVVGMLFILRGLELGIPHVSPKTHEMQGKMIQSQDEDKGLSAGSDGVVCH